MSGDWRELVLETDEPQDGEEEASESSAETAGFGERVSQLQGIGNGLRSFGRGLGSVASKTKGGLVKLLTTVFGPGSKIKLVAVGGGGLIVLIAVFILLAGIALLSVARQGTGGSTPAQQLELTKQETRENLQLVLCLDTAPPVATQQPTKSGNGPTLASNDNARISDACQTVNREQVEKARAQIAALREQLKSRTSAEVPTTPTIGLMPAALAAEPPPAATSAQSKTAQASTLLDQIEKELQGIDEANGKYKETKTHVVKANALIAQFVDVYNGLKYNCQSSSDLLGAQSPSNVQLYELKSHRQKSSSPIHFFYDAESRNGVTYVTPSLACYLAKLTVETQRQLGVQVEVGDASTATGVQAWGPHHQHGGGGNVDIWAQKVMVGDPQGSTFDPELSVKFAKLIVELGARELFITQNSYPSAIKLYSVNAGGHADHWHICIHTCGN